MFLHLLVDKEKDAFIDLARLAACCNGNVSDEEDIMIDQYCDEMGIETPITHAKTLDDVLAFFKDSSTQSKKTVVFEIIGLLFSDGNFDRNEMDFITKVAVAFGISKVQVEEMLELNARYLNILNDILCVIKD